MYLRVFFSFFVVVAVAVRLPIPFHSPKNTFFSAVGRLAVPRQEYYKHRDYLSIFTRAFNNKSCKRILDGHQHRMRRSELVGERII